MEPPMRSAPGAFSAGIDSPVMRLSSAIDVPCSTFPSTGIFEPGTTYLGIIKS